MPAMRPWTRGTEAVIDWANLLHNFRTAKAAAPGKVYAVVKADGYGHGAVNCVETLKAEADGFAVSCVDEAVTLRESRVEGPLLVMQGAYSPLDWEIADRYGLDLVIQHAHQLEDRRAVTLKGTIGVWLKINTGMNRVGVRLGESADLLLAIEADKNLVLRHVMTHFANADRGTDAAVASALCILEKRPWPVPLSVSNSAALLSKVAARVETADSVSRPGICLYGGSPLPGKLAKDLGLKTVMTLRSRVINTRKVPKGEPVGYGGIWRAERDSRIVVVAIGYGDGYPRQAPNGTPVLVKGHRCPLAGRVSMDMITVDVTDYPDVSAGDPVELWGPNIDVDEIARLCGTISYELFCQLTPRVRRVSAQKASL